MVEFSTEIPGKALVKCLGSAGDISWAKPAESLTRGG